MTRRRELHVSAPSGLIILLIVMVFWDSYHTSRQLIYRPFLHMDNAALLHPIFHRKRGEFSPMTMLKLTKTFKHHTLHSYVKSRTNHCKTTTKHINLPQVQSWTYRHPCVSNNFLHSVQYHLNLINHKFIIKSFYSQVKLIRNS